MNTILEAAQSLVEITKTQKKDFRRKSTFQANATKADQNTIPSWETIWSEMKYSDWIVEKSLELMEEEEYREEFEQETGLDHEFNESDFSEWIIEEYIKPEHLERYNDVIWFIKNELDGVDCWRSMKLSKNTDPVKHMDLGIYWSTNEDGAQPYLASIRIKNPQEVIYKAKVDVRNVNLPQMVLNRMNPAHGDFESEVTFIKGSRIWVYEVEMDNQTTPINGWRYT